MFKIFVNGLLPTNLFGFSDDRQNSHITRDQESVKGRINARHEENKSAVDAATAGSRDGQVDMSEAGLRE